MITSRIAAIIAGVILAGSALTACAQPGRPVAAGAAVTTVADVSTPRTTEAGTTDRMTTESTPQTTPTTTTVTTTVVTTTTTPDDYVADPLEAFLRPLGIEGTFQELGATGHFSGARDLIMVIADEQLTLIGPCGSVAGKASTFGGRFYWGRSYTHSGKVKLDAQPKKCSENDQRMLDLVADRWSQGVTFIQTEKSLIFGYSGDTITFR